MNNKYVVEFVKRLCRSLTGNCNYLVSDGDLDFSKLEVMMGQCKELLQALKDLGGKE